MKKIVFISAVLMAPQFSIAEETVEIKKDKDGYTATYNDGKKEYHPKGNTRKEVKEVYTSQGVKVKPAGRNPGGSISK